MDFAESKNLTWKHNSDHTALKHNGKNIAETSYAKKKGTFRIVVRKDCLTEEEQANLILHNSAREVGNSTFVLDFAFRTTSYSVFEQVLDSELVYQIQFKYTKKATA